ncbi:hypothetical protein Taro_052240 [Colocasia esculenta]|uniref:Uncharacterized protein n=1 Tax=Colocasia esculenta TaxID=4460 RepID=A0A843XHX6_COLES|nr:hypothetical protein [Colocasia esculenta]
MKNTQIGYGTTSPPLHATSSRREHVEIHAEMPNRPKKPQELAPHVICGTHADVDQTSGNKNAMYTPISFTTSEPTGSTNASNVPTSSKIRKSRGKFKGLETLKKIRGYNNAKLHVQINMEFRRSFGENADGLVGEIARLVTLCASFDVPYWHGVPEDRKDNIYEKILAMSEINKVNRSKQVYIENL